MNAVSRAASFSCRVVPLVSGLRLYRSMSKGAGQGRAERARDGAGRQGCGGHDAGGWYWVGSTTWRKRFGVVIVDFVLGVVCCVDRQGFMHEVWCLADMMQEVVCVDFGRLHAGGLVLC